MNILKEIASWAKKRPSWLSDAIRRLLLQNELSEEDREDILLLLKAEKGIILPEGSTIKAKPVTDTEFSEPDVAARKVILKKLHSLKNVNALAPEQTIEFLKEGLTVIFGGNATGKSGYSRVLKRACRSREEQEQVLPNVFQVDSDSDETSRIPEATIEVLVDSETEELHWIGGEPSPEVLSEIAVFDSKCMRIIVDEENAVVYMPYGMDVFKKLADLFAFLRERLQQETKSLDKPFDIRSEFGETTEAGKLLSQISHSTDVSILAQLSDITEEDYKRIDELERRIAELKLSDPLKKAARFNRLVQRISLLIGDIIKISHAISDESVIKYRAQCKNTREAIEASALASKEAFRDEPLTGVGSEPWKMMFQAAKRYSESIAYPSQDFPVTGDDSRCVLCQQSLQGKAKERMERFRLFIEADLANKEAAERSKQEIMESEYKAVTADLHSKYSDLLDQVREEDEETYRKVLGYLTRVDSRVLFIGEAFKSGEWDKLEKDEPISPAVDLENLKERLTREISELEATSSTEERAKLENELNELRDRERLKKYKSKIEKHIEDIKQLHKLNLCIKPEFDS